MGPPLWDHETRLILFRSHSHSELTLPLLCGPPSYPNKVEGKKEAMKLPGIGKSIGEKIEEYVKTGKIQFAEELLGLSSETKEQAAKEAKEKEQGMAFAFMD